MDLTRAEIEEKVKIVVKNALAALETLDLSDVATADVLDKTALDLISYAEDIYEQLELSSRCST